MSTTVLKKFKFYFAWDEGKGARWLESMARDGWLLESVTPFCRHTFRRAEPGDFAYRIDFLSKKDPCRDQLYRDAGWEHVAGCSGWHYWRKQGAAGAHAELFTDNTSLVKKYWRVLIAVSLANVPMIFLIANSDIRTRVINQLSSGSIILAITLTLGAAALVFNTYGIIRLALRIRASHRNVI